MCEERAAERAHTHTRAHTCVELGREGGVHALRRRDGGGEGRPQRRNAVVVDGPEVMHTERDWDEPHQQDLRGETRLVAEDEANGGDELHDDGAAKSDRDERRGAASAAENRADV